MNKPRSSIRMLLTVPEAFTELYAALETVPERLRAERIRTLATIGLIALRGQIEGGAQSDVAAAIAAHGAFASQPAPANERRRESVKKLAESM